MSDQVHVQQLIENQHLHVRFLLPQPNSRRYQSERRPHTMDPHTDKRHVLKYYRDHQKDSYPRDIWSQKRL